MSTANLTVGLTGGIGAGKSLATAALRAAGAKVVDADEIAREQAARGGDAFRKIVKRFGRGVVGPDGELERTKLAELVFDDPEKRLELERITHPLVKREMARRLQAAKGVRYAAVPLLFEAGMQDDFDVVVSIEAPDTLRARRVAARDRLTRAQIAGRMSAQLPDSERRERADVVIENSGSKSQFLSKVRSYHRAFTLLRHGAAAAR